MDESKLRFDFTAKKGLTVDQIKVVEATVRDLISKATPVTYQDSPLAQARAIQGLRAMFGETYPDPVRVVSVGADIPTMLADPTHESSTKTSVEFCGGT